MKTSRSLLSLTATTLWVCASGLPFPSAWAAPAPAHGVVGANLRVEPLDFFNSPESVRITIAYAIGDFRIVPEHSNNGDYAVQIGEDFADDVDSGILIPAVRENGRDLHHPLYPGTNFATAHIDYYRPGHERAGSYWIPVSMVWPNANSTAVIEYDTDLAAAWFPYSRYLGGFARNTTGANGGPNDLFTGSPGLTLGRHFVDLGSGRALVDLRDFGIDGRTDGVLLVVGAKNEDNYALSWVNPTNGTWILYSKDNGTDGASTEQDPLAFVYVPKTDPHLVVGRFAGDGSILLHSGPQAPFTITPLSTGRWELKIEGVNPRFGVLLVSPEGGELDNRDNIVTYQLNETGDGWILESRDLPAPTSGPFAPPLETPRGTTPVASFVFIPGPTPGIHVQPVGVLTTSENGDTANVLVSLDTPPAAPVTLPVTVTPATEVSVHPDRLVFTPETWNLPQTLTLVGLDDATVDGPVPFTLQIGPPQSDDPDYAALQPVLRSGLNLDNDGGGFEVLPLEGLVTDETGREASFTVRLSTPPAAAVRLPLTAQPVTEVAITPAELLFDATSWNIPQTVTVRGLDDPVVDGPVPFAVILGPVSSDDPQWHGRLGPTVRGTNLDNDIAAVLWEPPATAFALVEGQSLELAFRLASRPAATVTLQLLTTDPDRGGTLAPATLSIAPSAWNEPHRVTLRAADDPVPLGDHAWQVRVHVSSEDPLYQQLPDITLRLTTRDNEPWLDLQRDEVWYAPGYHPVALDGRARLLDPYWPDYDQVTLTVTLSGQVHPADRLRLRLLPPDEPDWQLDTPTLSHRGVTVATISGGQNAQPLQVRFTRAASPDLAQQILRRIVFETDPNAPIPTRRTAAVRLTHPDGGAHEVTRTIRVSTIRLADFQNGLDGGYGPYDGARDIQLYELRPDTPLPAGHNPDTNHPRMWLDYRDPDTPNQSQVLLRFDHIIGNGPGQISPGSKILAAELLLDVIDAGDGGPLYRMLQPWDEEQTTWNTFGYGITPNDQVARSTHDSFWGVPAVTGDTGIGTVSIGVRRDLEAWANGEPNHGWALISWNSELNPAWGNGTDGLAFSACEHPVPERRPRLRVWWVPADALQEAVFQQGVDHYTGCRDTRIRMNAPDTSATTAASAFVDWAVSPNDVYNPDIVLLRFDNILGPETGQIPPGATVELALLDLTTSNSNGYGDGGTFHAMLRPWEDTDTWNSLGGGIRADNTDARTEPTAVAGNHSLNPNVCGGYMSFEVTPDVAAWVRGQLPNYGWAILPWPGGADGWGLSMSEHPVVEERPRLRVYYRAATPITPLQITHWSITGNELSLICAGPAGREIVVESAPTLQGPWTEETRLILPSDGTRTGRIHRPDPETRFYRLRLN